jgi:hypothetical protein
MIHANDEQRTSNADGRDDHPCEEGGQMGMPLLEQTHGGDAYWPEIGEEGFITPACDCCFDPNGRCGDSIHVATMARCEASEEIQETMSDDILDRARTVCKDRGEDYGDPTTDFTKIARLWDVVFRTEKPITPEQVALAMILLKVARITQNPDFYHADSVLDVAGYANCLEKVASDRGSDETVTLEEMKDAFPGEDLF